MPLEPWPHQLDEADWITQRLWAYLNGDMGTGKTGACLIAMRACQRVLVCCPIAVGPAWVKQVGLWDSGRETCLVVDGSSKARAKAVEKVAARDNRFVVVTNYDAVWRGELGKQIEAVQWDAIVLDESHLVKSPSGKRSRWLAKLAARHKNAKRICLSGTPCPNSPLDWWAQFRFLNPEILGGSYTAFRSRIANTHPRHPAWVIDFKPEAIQALSKRLDPHVYRVTADQVLTLPDAIHTDIVVSLPADARKYYEAIEDEMVATLDTGETVTAANKLVVIGKLQQATSGFAVTSEGQLVPVSSKNPKREALREWLECLPANEPVVIFCKFISDLDACRDVLRELGRSSSELSGREKSLDQWQRGDTTALVVQQQAGGVGVDMTRSCYCLYYSLSHSLGDFEQSTARIRRPGQTRPCRFYHLVAENTVDEAIYRALQEKRDVAEAVYSRLTRRVPA
jgi:SNF2 family DNA or RNA helicase